MEFLRRSPKENVTIFLSTFLATALAKKRRAMCGYARVSHKVRQVAAQFRFESEDINVMLREMVMGLPQTAYIGSLGMPCP